MLAFLRIDLFEFSCLSKAICSQYDFCPAAPILTVHDGFVCFFLICLVFWNKKRFFQKFPSFEIFHPSLKALVSLRVRVKGVARNVSKRKLSNAKCSFFWKKFHSSCIHCHLLVGLKPESHHGCDIMHVPVQWTFDATCSLFCRLSYSTKNLSEKHACFGH